MSEPYYVLLGRHAKHTRHQLVRTNPADANSPYPTELVGDRLLEHLRWQPPLVEQPTGRIRIAAAFVAPTREARSTMVLLGRTLGDLSPDPRSLDDLSPGEVYSVTVPNLCSFRVSEDGRLGVEQGLSGQRNTTLIEDIRGTATNTAGKENAVLVMGHQPQLGRLADELARDEDGPGRFHLRRLRLPIASGEIVCLAFAERGAGRRRRRPRLLWAITPSDIQAEADLREKIKSKVEVAKLLGGVITLLLGVLLTLFLDAARWKALETAGGPGPAGARLAAGFLLMSVALYLATIYAYDRLTMPSRFWAESVPLPFRPRLRGRGLVRRPPSSAAWVLYQNMQRIWWGLFTPATISLMAALLVLAVVFLRVEGLLLGVIGLGALVVAGLWFWFRPVVGSED
ncbi:hypothetical protein [Nonomuraea sp. GTA35]|uniref:hypothetical protein n=1 Tax=Nonomuraea sp. GTA35 TaxID=1676746 RepID=UPI0035C08B69